MDPLKILCIYEAYSEDVARKRSWVNPLNSQRLIYLQFHTLYEHLCANPDMFEKYYHMPLRVFQELLHHIKPFIIKSDTNMRLAISPEERLIITLKYVFKVFSLLLIFLKIKD